MLGHFQKLFQVPVRLEHLCRYDCNFDVRRIWQVDAMGRERRKSRLELWSHRTCAYVATV